MYFKFIASEEIAGSKAALELKRICKSAPSLEDIIIAWVIEERHFTISKRFDDIAGKPKIFIEFFEQDKFVGFAKTSVDDFMRRDFQTSSLGKMVLNLNEEIIECYPGEVWFKRNPGMTREE